MVHDPKCPVFKGPCCPWVEGGCDCQCMCDFISDIRGDERDKAAQRVEAAWAQWEEPQSVDCVKCYTKQLFDVAADAALGDE